MEENYKNYQNVLITDFNHISLSSLRTLVHNEIVLFRNYSDVSMTINLQLKYTSANCQARKKPFFINKLLIFLHVLSSFLLDF